MDPDLGTGDTYSATEKPQHQDLTGRGRLQHAADGGTLPGHTASGHRERRSDLASSMRPVSADLRQEPPGPRTLASIPGGVEHATTGGARGRACRTTPTWAGGHMHTRTPRNATSTHTREESSPPPRGGGGGGGRERRSGRLGFFPPPLSPSR
jgi:hypothetical protein